MVVPEFQNIHHDFLCAVLADPARNDGDPP
jgi:hypothetical protein